MISPYVNSSSKKQSQKTKCPNAWNGALLPPELTLYT